MHPPPAGGRTPNGPLRIAVGVATSGRPAILAQTIGLLLSQSRKADEILICPARESDADPTGWNNDPAVRLVHGQPGLPAQRNTLLAASGSADVVVFFDDDFFPEPDFLAEIESLFRRRPDVVMATGQVLADGILGPGLTPEEALVCLANAGSATSEVIEEVHNGYGCNMAVRMQPVRDNALRFDETLPLYGWLEDVDFSRRLAPSGRIVRSTRLRGVHLGNKGGRTKGVRLGYSQVVNPLYMVRKGTLARGRAYRQIARNIAANAMKTFRPEPWVDRRGRLIGNLRGAIDAARGKLDPRRVLQL